MSVKGIEQVMPKTDHVGHIQRIANEGASAERFVLQLNQQLQAKRKSVPETTKSKENRVDNSDPRKKKRYRPPKKKRLAVKRERVAETSAPGRGNRLDIRA